MHILATVIRGHLPCFGRNSTVSCKLFNVKPELTVRHLVFKRGQATACMKVCVLKQKQVVIWDQKRGLITDLLASRIKHTPKRFVPKYVKDDVPRDYEIIYTSELGEKHLRFLFGMGIVLISYMSFFLYMFLVYMGEWKFDEKTIIPYINIEVPSLALQLTCILTVCLLVVLYFPFVFAKLPVKRIYESPCKKKYIGILKKGAFRTEKVHFEMSDVESRKIAGSDVIKKGNAIIKGRQCIVFATDFKEPHYFNQFITFTPESMKKKLKSER